MKNYLVILLFIFQVCTLCAGDFRINISGINGTALKPGSASDGVVLQQAVWLKQRKDQTLSCNVTVSREWKKYSFTFMPKKTGKYTFSIMSSNEKFFASCDGITVEGTTLKNGNFEELNSSGEPKYWVKMKKPLFSQTGGVDNSRFVSTAHNDRWTQIINCTKGVEVKVTFYARTAK